MKTLLILMMSFMSANSNAGFYDEDYFEPLVLGGFLAYGAYEVSSGGNEIAYAFVAFGLGYMIASESNEYFKYKVNRHYMSKLEDKKAKNAEYKQFFIDKATNGDTDILYGIMTTKETDTQKVNDSIISGSRTWSFEEY